MRRDLKRDRNIVFEKQQHHVTFHFLYVCLLEPGPFPDEDGGLGPDPGTHSDSRPKHGEQVDFLHHQAGPVLNGAFWDGLVGLRGDCHIGFTPVEHIERDGQSPPPTCASTPRA